MTTQPRSRFLPRSVKAGLCVLFIGGLLTSVGALTAAAQSAYNPGITAPPPGDTVTVSELVLMLTSPIVAQRDRALQQVMVFARLRPDIDLTPTVPALVDIYKNNPNEKYRLAAVVTLYRIGDESGLQQVRQRFVQEPSLIVQYVSVCALIDLHGPKAFGRDTEAVTLARNVLARKHEAQRLADQRHLLMVPRVEVGPLEVAQPESLR